VRLHAPQCFLGTLLARIGYPPNPRVLDVGSGPISTLYAEAKREEIELTCSDALAKDYGALLAEAGINDVHPIVSVKGEDLTQVFLRDEFDLVWIISKIQLKRLHRCLTYVSLVERW
jgi:hypothetical protein